MSDRDMIRSEGRTVDEAISEALLHLGARKDEVEITVIEEGKSGLFGVLGRKAACVEVRRKERKRGRRRGGRGRGRGRGEGGEGSRDQQQARGRGEGRGRQERQDRDERKQEAREERPRAENAAGGSEEGGEGRRRRRRRGGRGRGRGRNREEQQVVETNADAPVEQTQQAASEAPRSDDRPDDRDDGRRRRRRPSPEEREQRRAERTKAARVDDSGEAFDDVPNETTHEETVQVNTDDTKKNAAAEVVSGEPIVAMDLAERMAIAEGADLDQVISATTEDLMKRCGFFCRANVSEGEDGYRNVRIVTDAGSADAMAGRRNSMISSVQHLVDRIVSNASGDHVKVDVDINNYRQRRDGKLARLASDAMSRVRETGEPDHLPPMNARERRVVHMEVAEVDGLSTITEGEGPDRHVVIVKEQDGE